MTQEPDSLIAAISAAIAAHDPLDPWLVQSNNDDHYWDDNAATAAPLIATAHGESDVYQVLKEVLRPLIRSPDEDEYVRTRLEAAAGEISRWLRAQPD